VTTSVDPKRQKEQLDFNTPAWTLSDVEVAEIDAAGAKVPFRKFWGHVKDAQWDD
jgi:hypothetical protein